jgi:hypothetical protein
MYLSLVYISQHKSEVSLTALLGGVDEHRHPVNWERLHRWHGLMLLIVGIEEFPLYGLAHFWLVVEVASH